MDAQSLPPQVDYREHPNTGQAGDPPYTPETYDHPTSSVAAIVAPQPKLPGAGYTLEDEPARSNVMQPGSGQLPVGRTPQNPDPTSISQWDYLETTD